MTAFILILHFTCGHGCGSPADLTLPHRFATEIDCRLAGEQWVSPKANPQRAIRAFECQPVKS